MFSSIIFNSLEKFNIKEKNRILLLLEKECVKGLKSTSLKENLLGMTSFQTNVLPFKIKMAQKELMN